MQITLYNNFSAENVVHKTKTLLTTLNGDLLENTNMERVVVTIPYNANYNLINYAYIPEFKRFYFVAVDVLVGQLLRLTMQSDPISSFYESYKKSQCIARRSSSNVNTDIVDNKLPFKPQPKFIFRKCGTAFTPTSSGNCYVLTLGGM